MKRRDWMIGGAGVLASCTRRSPLSVTPAAPCGAPGKVVVAPVEGDRELTSVVEPALVSGLADLGFAVLARSGKAGAEAMFREPLDWVFFAETAVDETGEVDLRLRVHSLRSGRTVWAIVDTRSDLISPSLETAARQQTATALQKFEMDVLKCGESQSLEN